MGDRYNSTIGIMIGLVLIFAPLFHMVPLLATMLLGVLIVFVALLLHGEKKS